MSACSDPSSEFMPEKSGLQLVLEALQAAADAGDSKGSASCSSRCTERHVARRTIQEAV